MDAGRSGMPLRAINRVTASCGRTTETAESIATWGGWFSLKYFAICAPWALASFDGVVMDGSVPASDCGWEPGTKLQAIVRNADTVRPEFCSRQPLAEDDRSAW